MEALTELCDLVAQNPTLFADKLSWICGRCPPPSAPRLTRPHLNSLLTLARFLSKCSAAPPSSQSPLLDFLRSAPLRPSIWPPSSNLDSIAAFFSDLFKYISVACVVSADLALDLRSFFGKTLISAAEQYSSSDAAAAGIARVFLNAVVQNCPPMLPADVERAVECLLDGIGAGEATESSNSSASWDSKGKGKEAELREVTDDGSSEAVTVRENGGGTPRKSGVDQMENGGSMIMTRSVSPSQQDNGSDEAVETLERMEIVFRIVVQVLERGGENLKLANLDQVRKVATSQLKSLPAFLKVK